MSLTRSTLTSKYSQRQPSEAVWLIVPFSKLGTEIVDIFVGTRKEPFKVYLKLLCKKVPYFASMFGVKYKDAEGSKFKEGEEGIAYLPEDNPRTFSLLLGWVYSGSLPPFDTTGDKIYNREHESRLYLYFFAEKICLNDLMDCTMTSIISVYHKTKRMPSPAILGMVYARTSPGSSLRKFFALCFYCAIFAAEECCSTLDVSDALGSNVDLRMDAIRLIKSGGVHRDPRGLDACEFRMHDENGKSSCLYRTTHD